MEAGTIGEWKKKQGDKFAPGDVICSVETDKATVDFEAQEEGYVAKILVEAKSREVKVRHVDSASVGNGISCLNQVGEPIMVAVEDQASIEAFRDYSSSSGAGMATPAAPKAAAAVAAPPKPQPSQPTPQPQRMQDSGKSDAAKDGSDRVFASPLARKVSIPAVDV